MNRADYLTISEALTGMGEGFAYGKQRRDRKRELEESRQARRDEIEAQITREEARELQRRGEREQDIKRETEAAQRAESARNLDANERLEAETRAGIQRGIERQIAEQSRQRDRESAERTARLRNNPPRVTTEQQVAEMMKGANAFFNAPRERRSPPMARVRQPTENGGEISFEQPLAQALAATPQAPQAPDPQRAEIERQVLALTSQRGSGGEYPGSELAYRIPGLGAIARAVAGPSRSERIRALQGELDSTAPAGMVAMVDPRTGQQGFIPSEKVAEAEAKGLRRR